MGQSCTDGVKDRNNILAQRLVEARNEFWQEALRTKCPKTHTNYRCFREARYELVMRLALSSYFDKHGILPDPKTASRIVKKILPRTEMDISRIREGVLRELELTAKNTTSRRYGRIWFYWPVKLFRQFAALGYLPKRLRKKMDVVIEARNRFVLANYFLAVSIAKKYRLHNGIVLSDLIQGGMEGSIEAAERFDYSLGNKFSTYAVSWIRFGVIISLYDQMLALTLDPSGKESAGKLRSAISALSDGLGRNPDFEEIARTMGASEEKVRCLIAAIAKPVSLHREIPGDESGTLFIDRLEDPSLKADDMVAESDWRIKRRFAVEGAMEHLGSQEKKVLDLRFGMKNGDGEGRTLEETGVSLKVTRARVKQIQDKALRKLRNWCPELRQFLVCK